MLIAASLEKRLPNTPGYRVDWSVVFFSVEIVSHLSAGIAPAPCPCDTRGFYTAVSKVGNVTYRALHGVLLPPRIVRVSVDVRPL